MPSDRSTLTTSEIDAALTATATSRLMNGKNKVAFTGNVKTPTLNMLRKNAVASTPVRGAYKCHFSPPRGQKLQSVSGRDIHTFRTVDTLFDLEFSVGRVHLGDEWVHQQIEEAGIPIDHAATSQTYIDVNKAGWWTKGSDTFEVLVNLADQKLQALELNYAQELNKVLWLSNVADAKLWQGIDGIVSRASNTTGPVGNKTRASPHLRHQLIAPISNTADIELQLDELRYLQNKRVADGSHADYNVCGRLFYKAVKERLFSGSSGVSSPRILRDYDNARSEAQAAAQKLGVGFPDDAIYVAGVGILAVEPVFEDLDRENAPAILFEKSYFSFNLKHFFFRPTKGKDGAKKIHATPYNQHVTRISCYGEYAVLADWLDCHGATSIT